MVKNPKNIDKSGMKNLISGFSKQFSKGIKAAEGISLKKGDIPKDLENIIICGMGGSALPGDIMAALRPLDVFVHKSYGLPPQAGKNSLIICISYSGNTEETLNAFNEALKKGFSIMAITTGGKLGQLCRENKIPVAIIPPPYMPPRLALGLQFSALAKILTNQKLLEGKAVKELQRLSESLKPERREKVKKLAKKIYQRIPVIYSTKEFKEVSFIWKISMNENAKIMAVSNYFPELNHNETVGWLKINERQISNKELLVIILKDADAHKRILKQIKITKEIIEKEGVEVIEIEIKGKSKLEKIFSTILLGFFVSYSVAMEYGIDPTPVAIIDEFKRKLEEN